MKKEGNFIIKFFKNKQHLYDFLEGRIYFSPINYFKNTEDASKKLLPHTDVNEGSSIFSNSNNRIKSTLIKVKDIKSVSLTDEGMKITTTGEFLECSNESQIPPGHIKLSEVSNFQSKSFQGTAPIMCSSIVGYRINKLGGFDLLAGDSKWLIKMMDRFDAEYIAVIEYENFIKILNGFENLSGISFKKSKVTYYDEDDYETFLKFQNELQENKRYAVKTMEYEIEKEFRIQINNRSIEKGTIFELPEELKNKWKSYIMAGKFLKEE